MKRRNIFALALICLNGLAVAQNTPPSISFSKPENHQQLPIGNVHLAVDAVDADNNIEKVSFWWGDSLLVEIENPPYDYQWENVQDGYYRLSAKVSDGQYSRTTHVEFYVGDEKIWRPYLGTPILLPGRIEVEHFDRGGPGVAYVDNDDVRKGCTGWQCRPDDKVDVGAAIDEAPEGETYNYFIGWTFPGNEWLDYTVQVDSTAEYVLKARIATAVNIRSFHLEIDGNPITDTIYPSHTLEHGKNEYYNYKNIYYKGVMLSKGVQTIRMIIHQMDKGYGGINFNYLEFLYPENNPPFVQFTTPSAIDTTIKEGEGISILVNAFDNETKVTKTEFYKGTALIGSDTEPPFTFQFDNLPPGEFRLSAKAYDTEGNSEVTLVKYVKVLPLATSLAKNETSDVNVWPNPFKDRVFLELQQNMAESVKINLYAQDGRLIPVEIEKLNNKMAVVDMEDLAPGLYLLKISDKQGIKTIKIIKDL